jgi:ketosteroid isomerase-like protein
MRMLVTAALLTIAPLAVVSGAPAALAISGQQKSDAASVLSVWFRHVERNELDSLRSLLTDDFRFVSGGTRQGPDAFIAMIKGLGIRSPRVQLKNVDTHRRGDIAYLVYDRNETVRVGRSSKTFPETGSVVLVRTNGVWRIAQWAATSP